MCVYLVHLHNTKIFGYQSASNKNSDTSIWFLGPLFLWRYYISDFRTFWL